MSIRAIYDPACAIIQRQFGDLHLHVAVRPSPPYRDWVVIDEPPRSWQNVIAQENRTYRRQRPPNDWPRTASAQTEAPCAIHQPDAECSAQTDSHSQVESGVGPDLCHLVTTLVCFRTSRMVRPEPRLLALVTIDEFGAIQSMSWFFPTIPECEVPKEAPPPPTHPPAGNHA